MATDSELVKQALNGKYTAFDQLVDRYQDGIYRMSLLLLGQTHEALDAAQEIFARSYRSLPDYNDTLTYKTWLYRSALYFLAGHNETLRRNGYLRPAGEIASGTYDVIASINVSDTAIMSLAELEMPSDEEIGEILAVAAETVSNRLEVARAALIATLPDGFPSALKTMKAPPGFNRAIRENLAPEIISAPPIINTPEAIHAHESISASPPVARRRSPLPVLVIAVILLCALGGWLFFQIDQQTPIPNNQPLIQEKTAKADTETSSSPLNAAISPAATMSKPATSEPEITTTQVATPRKALPVQSAKAPALASPPKLPTVAASSPAPVKISSRGENGRSGIDTGSRLPAEDLLAADADVGTGPLPEIVVAKPKSGEFALASAFGYVNPRLSPPPRKERGNVWVVEVNSAQFVNMQHWLRAFYSEVKITGETAPKEGSRVKVRLRED